RLSQDGAWSRPCLCSEVHAPHPKELARTSRETADDHPPRSGDERTMSKPRAHARKRRLRAPFVVTVAATGAAAAIVAACGADHPPAAGAGSGVDGSVLPTTGPCGPEGATQA